jgi:hypothetical protein
MKFLSGLAAATLILSANNVGAENSGFQAYQPNQYKEPRSLSFSRFGYVNSTTDENLILDDVTGLVWMGERYNSAGVGFLWRMNILAQSQQDDEFAAVTEDVVVVDYSIGLGYGLPMNKLDVNSGFAGLDNGHLMIKGSYGFDYQSYTASVGSSSSSFSMSTSYFKLGAGVRMPLTDFWDVELMLENVSIGDYELERDDGATATAAAKDSGLGISLSTNLFFEPRRSFGVSFEMNHGVHDTTALTFSKNF